MPAPVSNAELIDLVQKSGVVETSRLGPYLQSLRDRGSVPAEPQKLAGLLVRDGLLTYFQAGQILLGKYKRFFIGKYKVLEKLGSGGMGQVFLCEHVVMRRRVAVKVLPTAKAGDPAALERFYREARAVAALDHANLVRAYDIDRDESLHYLVMEYIDGSNLHELVKKAGPLPPTRACHYVYRSAIGLQYAFEVANLIHRDIKPSNILVDRQGGVKILDMGLARFFLDEEDILTKKYDESTLGTADYLAPEQAVDSHEVDIRADIYSLGATFYFLLAGAPPFAEGSVAQKLIWHQTRPPTPIDRIRGDVAPGIVAILERMMAKDPASRYRTPGDLADALLPFVQTPIAPPSDGELPHMSAAVTGTVGPSSVSGRFAVPRLPPQIPRADGSSAVGQSSSPTAPNSNGMRPTTAPPVPIPAAGARKELNPFANLLAAEAHPLTRPADKAEEAVPVRPVVAPPIRKRLPLWLLLAAAALAFAGIAVGAWQLWYLAMAAR